MLTAVGWSARYVFSCLNADFLFSWCCTSRALPLIFSPEHADFVSHSKDGRTTNQDGVRGKIEPQEGKHRTINVPFTETRSLRKSCTRTSTRHIRIATSTRKTAPTTMRSASTGTIMKRVAGTVSCRTNFFNILLTVESAGVVSRHCDRHPSPP